MKERVQDCRALDEAQARIHDIDTSGELPLTVRRRLRESLVAGGRDLMKVKTYLDNKFLLGQEYFPAVYAGFAS